MNKFLNEANILFIILLFKFIHPIEIEAFQKEFYELWRR